MSKSDVIGIGLTILVASIFGTYLKFYNPPEYVPTTRDCVKWREKRSGIFFGYSECIQWGTRE